MRIRKVYLRDIVDVETRIGDEGRRWNLVMRKVDRSRSSRAS